MSDTPLILVPGQEANSAIEKKLRADAFAKRILDAPAGTPERWKRIFQVWYGLDPNARQDHIWACEEAADVRATIEDKDYGLTRASRGVAKGEDVNGHVQNALVAVMPEKLKAWLVRFDPYLNVNVNKGAKEQRQAWRRVYTTFPMYRTTLKQRKDF